MTTFARDIAVASSPQPSLAWIERELGLPTAPIDPR